MQATVGALREPAGFTDDLLPGLVVDRYGDVLSAEVFSLGMYQRIGSILPLLAEEAAQQWTAGFNPRPIDVG